MSSLSSEIQTLLDRENIRACIAAVARGEDRRDADLIKTCFWPDATSDYGIFSGSFDDYLAWIVPGSPAVPVTQHMLGQTVIELRGETALAETHANVYHRIDMGAEHRDTVMGGRYLDRLEKRSGEWRIVQRTMLYDWFQDIGTAADWSQGLMGTAFSGDHYTGRAHGDYSEVFFSEAAYADTLE